MERLRQSPNETGTASPALRAGTALLVLLWAACAPTGIRLVGDQDGGAIVPEETVDAGGDEGREDGGGADEDGEADEAEAAACDPDSPPPTVGIDRPAEGSRVRDVVEVVVSTSGECPVVAVRLAIDGEAVASTPGSSLSWSWDTTPYEYGTHVLEATATDVLGRDGHAEVRVEVDRPIAVVLSAYECDPGLGCHCVARGAGATLCSRSEFAEVPTMSGIVRLEAAVTDDGPDLDRVEFLVDGAVVGTVYEEPLEHRWDTTTAEDGIRMVEARATNSAGDSATAGWPVSVLNCDRDGDLHLSRVCAGGDCDDRNAAVHPGAVDVCDGADNDCDGVTDGDFECARGMPLPCTTTCGTIGIGPCSEDCTVPDVSACTPPVETCGDLVDDDCDGVTDTLPCCPGGMAGVREGPFIMGSEVGDGGIDEEPRHIVTMSAFCIDLTEATVSQWQACAAAGACTIDPDSHGGADDPALYVDWEGARAFCAWAGKRLPTEAEWEKAARGGCELAPPETCGPEDARVYPWGDARPSCERALYLDACWPPIDTRVGVRPAGDGPYGAHDMAGNVWEWVEDWYGLREYSTCAEGCTDPTGPDSGRYHVLRGGDRRHGREFIRVSYRGAYSPGLEGGEPLGVRCALTP